MPYRNRQIVILFTFCLTFSVSIVESYKPKELCKDLSSKSREHRLKMHLFCDYDTDVRPQIGAKGNVTNVGLIFMPRFISFDDTTNVFTLESKSFMNWTDPFLTWNPEDFEGLRYVHVPINKLWTPDITVHNPRRHDENDGTPGFPAKTDCSIHNDGRVMCKPDVKYSVSCHSDYTDYPYDIQICTIELASWAYSTKEIEVSMASKLHDMFSQRLFLSLYEESLEWDVLFFNQYTETDLFKMNAKLETRKYGLIIIIARRAENMHIVFIVPAFVLMALTLCTLWLDCHSNERMIVSSISFICHLICIQRVYWSIPHSGNIAPNLLRYYESSFLIMAFVMVLTVLLRELHALKSPAPAWLSSTTSSILRSKVGQLLLLSILDPKASAFLEVSADDNDGLVDGDGDGDGDDRPKPESNTSTWSYVALIIGWLAFVLIFFTYIVMLPMYLPYKPSDDVEFFRKLNSQSER